MKRNLLFPTAIYSDDLPNAPELNKDLIKKIKQWRKKEQGIRKTNRGGWHSPTNMHMKEEFKPLVDELLCMATGIGTEECYTRPLMLGNMWTNVNYPGCYNRDHMHSNADWSGVYYVQTPDNCGHLSILDPRHGANMLVPRQKPIKEMPDRLWKSMNYYPVAGRLIMFPAYLIHGVDINRSKKKGEKGWRISVSFNFIQK